MKLNIIDCLLFFKLRINNLDTELVLIICKYLKASECLNLLLTQKRFGTNKWLINEIKKLFIEIKITDIKKCWLLNNKYHRENDKPSVIWSNGSKEWYKNGKCQTNKLVL